MTDTKAGELAEVIARVRAEYGIEECETIPPDDYFLQRRDMAAILSAASRVAQLEGELANFKEKLSKSVDEVDRLEESHYETARIGSEALGRQLHPERTQDVATDLANELDTLRAELKEAKADAERDRTLLQRVAIALESLDLCPTHQGIWFLCPSGCALRMDVAPAAQEEKP